MLKPLNQNNMRNAIIHFISYMFMLMICFTIQLLLNNEGLTLTITFMLGWATYPLIQYLQEKPKSE